MKNIKSYSEFSQVEKEVLKFKAFENTLNKTDEVTELSNEEEKLKKKIAELKKIPYLGLGL